jgi:hypothetical protein
MTHVHRAVPAVRLGLRENVAQFSLLVIINGFVGAMVGMERSILPLLAEQEFHLAARSAIRSRTMLRDDTPIGLAVGTF